MTDEETTPVDPVEAELMSLLDAGQLGDATTLLMESYGPGILGMLAHTLNDEDEAKDIFSMWCEDVWKGLGGFEGRARVKTWSYRIARNALARYKRAPHQRRGRRLNTEGMPEREAELMRQRVHETTRRWRRTTTKDAFRGIREQLSDEENMLLILHVDRGMSWAEVAEIMDEEVDMADRAAVRQAANRLRQKFHRVKQKLRRLAEAEGLITQG